MNSLCRRFVAAFLAFILILPARQAFGGPHHAWALREPQEDMAVPALGHRLRSSSGLEERVALSVPGNLTLAQVQKVLVEALEGKTLPVKMGTIFFYLAEILNNTNRHDYHYDGQLHTDVTFRWDDQRVWVTIEDQTQQLFLLKKLLDESLAGTSSLDDPAAFVQELFGQLDADQNAAAAAGKSIVGKMGIPMLKRGYREQVFFIEEETHTPGRGTRRSLVFNKPSPASGLEEKSQDRQWKHTHAKIVKALRSHPGGRLMATDLAKRAGVGRVALYSHDYRSLAAAENKRRAGMKRLKPVIEVREYQERTEDVEPAIVEALRSHPGGRMTVEELAELADVGKLTLYNYNYRSLVEAENKHRAELKPPKPAIILLRPGHPPSAAGLEEPTTDWTLHWDAGGALADERDPLVLQKEPWRDFFESLRAQSSNARALDIGSGNLAVSLFAQGIWSGFDLHAIDRSDIHPERFSQSDKIQFRRADIEHSGYPDGHFEAVTGRYALEYTETDHSFPELVRILRPGGSGLFLLHHRDSIFVRNARLLTVDDGVLPTTLEAYEKTAAYLRNGTAENLQQRFDAIGRLLEYRDAAEPKVRQEAGAAYDNILAVLAISHDELQAPLEILGNHIRETRFIVNAHRDLVKAALSPEDVPEWARRLTEAGLVVDRFEPFYQDDIPDGWVLEIHKPLALAGLEERTSKSVNLLRQVPPAVPGSVGDAALVFREPETFDLAALAVRYGWSVAVLDDSPEVDALKELLDALPGPKGRYAVGLLESSRFLNGYQRQILIENRPEGFKILGLRWDDLPPPVSAALESVLAFLDTASQA